MFFFLKNAYGEVKGKGAREPKVHTARAYGGFCSMKHA